MARREEVNDLPSIAEILRHYGASLRATHGQVNLRCPFHSDTHQSGTANLDKISSSALPVVCRETVYK
jgi:hypothetical protein